MKFRLTDLPRYTPPETYGESIQTVLNSLSESEAVKTVFQIGGVSSPGISDIDFYIVFRDGSEFQTNPVKALSGIPSYHFTHNLFGTSENLATRMEPYTFFGNYKLLYGEAVNMNSHFLSPENKGIVEKQVALEYLAKAYLSISASINSGIIKARNILLHAKALQLDLELLGIRETSETQAIRQIVELRMVWFTEKNAAGALEGMILPYRESLRAVLSKAIEQFKFYVSEGTDMNVAKNMKLCNGNRVHVSRKGLSIPSLIRTSFSTAQRLQKRFSTHEIFLPLTTVNIPDVLHERTLLFREAEQLNKQRFPAFLPTAYGLHLFKETAK
jgi:hypothetical protein